MKSPRSFGLARRALPVLLGVVFAAPLSAQSTEDVFREGVQLYFRGHVEEALEKFKDVLAQDPSHEEAFRLYEQSGREVFALMLLKRGEFEAVAKSFLERATLARKAKTHDEAAINALVEAAMSGDYLARRDALAELSASFGEYGAAPFIAFLGNEEDEEARVNAIYCLTRLSGDSVLPLCAALQSDNERQVWNACACLGAIGDERAVPGLKSTFEAASSTTVQDAANDALVKITGRAAGGLPSSNDLHVDAAVLYFTGSPTVVTPFDTRDAVWFWDGGAVRHQAVPALLRPLELAEQHCFDAIQDPRAQAVLFASYAAEKAAVAAAESMEIELDVSAEAVAGLLQGLDVALAAGGPDGLSRALQFALRSDAPHAAEELLQSLASMGAATPAMREALGSPYKMVRYRAAFALAGAGQDDDQVVGVLSEALAEDAIRTVLVVDPHPDTRNGLVAILADAGYAAIAADSGGLGFARARNFPPKDVIIVRAGMDDVTVDRFVYSEDFRTAAAPILILATADQAEALSARYEGRGNVAGVLAEPFSPETVLAAVEAALGDLNAERAEALAAAEQAALLLARLAPNRLVSAEGILIGALERDEDTVMVPVLDALALLGPARAADPVVAIFADESRPEEIRVAAARALGGVLARLESEPGSEVVGPLSEAALADASEAVRLEAGRALGRARFLSAEQRAEFLRRQRAQ